MKKLKKLLIAIFGIAAFVAAAAFNVDFSSNHVSFSDMELANIEAIANCESPVQNQRGRPSTMVCPMEGGGTNTYQGCDCDDDYQGMCYGRCGN